MADALAHSPTWRSPKATTIASRRRALRNEEIVAMLHLDLCGDAKRVLAALKEEFQYIELAPDGKILTANKMFPDYGLASASDIG